MALPKISEVRDLSDEALSAQILQVKRDLFNLRLKMVTQEFKTPHEFKHLRHRLAQLMTVERERQLATQVQSATPIAEDTDSTLAESTIVE